MTSFILRNTHNDMYNDAGTRAYDIQDLRNNMTLAESTSPNPKNLVGINTIL